MLVYWGFFLRIDYFHLVSNFVNPESVQGPLNLLPVLLKNFRIDILPILSDPTVDCTRPKADCELVTLVAIILRVYTRFDGEGESSLYLGQTLVKLTWTP
jgi:hypothetical protein